MKKTSRKIIFFGNEKLATGLQPVEPIIQESVRSSGLEIEKVVQGSLDELGNHEAELAVLAAYGRIIPSEILDQFPLGIINVHPSLLPVYRGPTPIEQAILDGANKTGVSIMRLTSGMDEGPIYMQRTLQLTGSETKSELTATLQQLGADMLTEILPAIADGQLKPRSQPHPDRATYCQKLAKKDGQIDWTKPAEVIEREIRAFAGWPKSYTSLNGIEVTVHSAEITPQSGKPGELAINTTDKELIVYCGQNALSITKLQPASKKPMSVYAFLAGYSSRLN